VLNKANGMNRSRNSLGYISAGLLFTAAVGVFWWHLTRGIRYGPIWASSLLFTSLAVYSVTAGPFSEYLNEYEDDSPIREELHKGRGKHFDGPEEAVSRASYTQRDEERYIIEPLEEEGWEYITPNQERYPDWAREIVPEDILRNKGPEYEYAHYDVTGFFVYMLTSTVQETSERFNGTCPDDSGFHVFRKSRIRYMSRGEVLLFVVLGFITILFLFVTILSVPTLLVPFLMIGVLIAVLSLAIIIIERTTNLTKRLYPPR